MHIKTILQGLTGQNENNKDSKLTKVAFARKINNIRK